MKDFISLVCFVSIIVAVLFGVWKIYEIDPELFPSPYGSTRITFTGK